MEKKKKRNYGLCKVMDAIVNVC